MTGEQGPEIRPGVRRLVRPGAGSPETVRHETDEEIRLHIELRTRELMSRGWTEEEAEAEAVRRFGGMDRARRTLVRAALRRERRMRTRGWLEGVSSDARLALRRFAKRPGFAVVAVLTLALGVGANVALFSVLRDTLLDPLPFPEPDRLVRIQEVEEGAAQGGNLSVPNLRDLRARTRTLEEVGRFQFADVRARFGNETELLTAVLVEPEVFGLLGRQPLLGRLPEDGETEAVVVSHRLWRTRLGGDPAAPGRSLDLEGEPYTVVGVMPPDFAFTSSPVALWAVAPPPAEYMMNRRVHVSGALGRARPGLEPGALADDLARVSREIQADHAGEDPGHSLIARPLRDTMTGYARTPLLMLGGAVLLVLLVACANIAGLQVARAAWREGEMGVRLALGAGRLALLRQLLIENLLLFVLGAVVGVPVAVAGVRWLLAATPGGLPRAEEIGVDGPVLAAAFVFATVLGLLFGLLPALQAARTRIAGRLPGRSGGGSAAQALRSGLVIGQLALSVTLLAGAGLLARSLWELQNVDPGFRPEGLAVLRMSLPDDYAGERVPAFYRALPESVGAIPGVEAVTATNALPVSGGEGRGEITVDGRPFDPGSAPSASFRRVLPGYFDVMGIPLLAGRDFDERDGRGEPVVIVNATLAERMFPNGSAIGRRIRVGPSEDEPWLTVVGVVGDVRNETLEEVDAFATYEPHAQRPWSSMYVVARAAGGDPAALVAPIRDAVLAREPGLYVYEGGTMEERMADSTAARRFIATLLGGFALLALLLGTIGVYGLTAWTVARRRREMGIRMALGASHGRIVARMVGGAARLAVVGLALGSVGAVLFGRLLRGLLFEVSPFDPSTGLAIAAALGAATLLAAWLPTRRLEHADTVTVLAEP